MRITGVLGVVVAAALVSAAAAQTAPMQPDITNFKAPTDLPNALLHFEYSESDFLRATRHSRNGCCGHASTKIFDLQDHLICLSFHADDGIESP